MHTKETSKHSVLDISTLFLQAAMGLGYTGEIATKVSAARIFEAGAVDMHNFAPKILPDLIAGVKILQGDGGAGSIKQVDFTKASPWDYVKESVDVLDKEKFECHYTLFEGGDFGKKLKSASYKLKLVPQPDGGCIYKVAAEFETIPGADFTEADMETIKMQDIGQFRAIEAYLLANPTAYA